MSVDSGKVVFLKAILKPFKLLLNDVNEFRIKTKRDINLSPQTIVIENHIRNLTGLIYGISISDGVVNNFVINIPISGQTEETKITAFLNKIVPVGRNYSLNFYI